MSDKINQRKLGALLEWINSDNLTQKETAEKYGYAGSVLSTFASSEKGLGNIVEKTGESSYEVRGESEPENLDELVEIEYRNLNSVYRQLDFDKHVIMFGAITDASNTKIKDCINNEFDFLEDIESERTIQRWIEKLETEGYLNEDENSYQPGPELPTMFEYSVDEEENESEDQDSSKKRQFSDIIDQFYNS